MPARWSWLQSGPGSGLCGAAAHLTGTHPRQGDVIPPPGTRLQQAQEASFRRINVTGHISCLQHSLSCARPWWCRGRIASQRTPRARPSMSTPCQWALPCMTGCGAGRMCAHHCRPSTGPRHSGDCCDVRCNATDLASLSVARTQVCSASTVDLETQLNLLFRCRARLK